MSDQPGFFNVDDRLRRLSDLGDQLEAYAATIDFEILSCGPRRGAELLGWSEGR